MPATAKFWSTSHHIEHPWDQVTKFFWSRYPNPNSSHVFSEDFLEVGVDPEGNLRTKRLIMKTNKLPWWGKHLFAARKVAVIEETVVNPKAKVMVTYTRNIGLRLFMGTVERAEYRPIEGPDFHSTSCEKKVWIESDLVGLRSAIKKFGVDRFKANCVKATEGLVWAIENNQIWKPPPTESVNVESSPSGPTSSRPSQSVSQSCSSSASGNSLIRRPILAS